MGRTTVASSGANAGFGPACPLPRRLSVDTRARTATRPYGSDNYYVREVQTDVDGNGFITQSNGLFKDLRITHVLGTIYRFVALNVGQVETIRTLDGRVVERSRGLLKFSFLVDTKGDANPDNDEFIDESFLKDAGKHPAAYSTDEEFCAVIEEAMQGSRP